MNQRAQSHRLGEAGFELGPDQRRVRDLRAGALKLVGGAGSGKSTALLERAAALVEERGVEPESILFFVQDRRHAIDVRDRLVRRLGRSVAGPSVFTFHAFSWSLLTRGFQLVAEDSSELESAIGYELVGYTSEPVLLTAFDQRAFVRDLLQRERREEWPLKGHMLASAAFAGEVRDFILRAQERLLTPDDLRELASARGRDDWIELAGFYERYLGSLEDASLFADGRPRLDFARVLTEARRLIGEHEEVLGDLAGLYPHLLVDDFEEANRAELALLEALLPTSGDPARSAVVAGDPEGSVFGFRGADPRCFTGLDLEDLLELEGSHRGDGEPQVRLYSHVTEEVRGVVAELRQRHATTAWGDMAVIVRDYRHLLTPLRRELERAGVPYSVDGEALQLAGDPVVAPVIDLFTIACRRPGHEELWPGLITSKLGGFSAHELPELRRAARLAGIALHEICERAVDVSPSIEPKLRAMSALISEACGWAETLTPDACFWELWRRSEWFQRLVAAGDDRRLDSLTTFADALGRFTERRGRTARMADFIDTLVSAEFAPESFRLNRSDDAVTVTTAHASKGREFELGVVSGCVEGGWPDPSRRGLLLDVDLLDGPRGPGDRQRAALAEEHRLFTLAVSRASAIVLTGENAGGSERTSAEPSRFLEALVDELPTNSRVPELVLNEHEAEVAWRGRLADTSTPPPERLAALWGLAHLPHVEASRWWWGRPWTDNDVPVLAGRKKTSYSRFSSYENCPLAYLMGQVLGLDQETSYQMAYGRLVHEVLEKLEKKELEPQLDALMAEADARRREEDYPPGAVAGYLKRDIEGIFRRYLDVEYSNGHETLNTEFAFEFEVDGWVVRGKIDRIDRCGRDGLKLEDYKTGGYKRDSEVQGDIESGELPDLQLSTYLLACHRVEELTQLGRPRQADLLFLQYSDKYGIKRAKLSPSEIDGVPFDEFTERRIIEILEGIEAERFAPSPDANCRFCNFKPLCPMWPEGQELKVV